MKEPHVESEGRQVILTPHPAGFTWVGPEWEKFARRHAGWLGRIPPGPLYCLPEEAIARLEQPRFRHPALLDVAAAAAERDFLAVCQLCHAVGFNNGTLINYSHLDRSPRRSFRQDFPDHPWTEAQWLTVASLEGKVATISERLKGYAGWLVTETPFLEAAAALKTRWEALPWHQRPSFPLRRSVLVPFPLEVERARPASAMLAAFVTEFEAFCDRWGLLGMPTWDLPDPQGPLIPAPLPLDAPAMPRHGLHIVLPVHYPLAGNEEFLRQVLQLQRSLAKAQGIDTTAAGLPHHEAYATILEIVHWERVITGRYGRDQRRSGFIGLVVEAVAEAIHREVDLVEKWRKAISACRRGKRVSVKALFVRG
jgi:hypothetical protein